MKLEGLRPPSGAVKRSKRVGRGPGSGHGGTSGRGEKGQKARSGAKIKPWFEGGQMPIQRRLPKVGFTSPFRTEYQIVNVKDIVRKGLEGEITPETLNAAGLIKGRRRPVKILGEGTLEAPVSVRAHAFSKSAAEKIRSAGGQIEVI